MVLSNEEESLISFVRQHVLPQRQHYAAQAEEPLYRPTTQRRCVEIHGYGINFMENFQDLYDPNFKHAVNSASI